MPIYAYKCSACGHAEDVLQKISDAPLTVCPSCGQAAYAKQVTAAGFQLKGSGWYVTDFRGSGSGANSGIATPPKPAASSDGGSVPASGGAAPSTNTASPAAAPAPASTPAPAAAPSASSSSS